MSQTATGNQVEPNPGQALRIESVAATEKSGPIGVETKNTLLVVAALVMTATYQAVLQPPGGLWQDDDPGNSNSTSNAISTYHFAGKSVMASKRPFPYVMFLLFNSMGFYGSYQVIWSVLEGFPMKRELRLAMFAILVTYDVSMGALTPSTTLNWVFVVISILMPFLFPMIVKLIKHVRD